MSTIETSYSGSTEILPLQINVQTKVKNPSLLRAPSKNGVTRPQRLLRPRVSDPNPRLLQSADSKRMTLEQFPK
ncbi:hypothetical protein J6590_024993 [Homalodisca vitripennis]|nr:hypothetical protein J6590_024993 [Homalodisca vitripennis]